MNNNNEIAGAEQLPLPLNEEQVLSPVDAVIQISISYDKLEAYMNIIPPENGGAEPDIDIIKNELNSNNVVYGINESKLKEISQKPQYNKKIIIAKGVPAVNGEDGTYEILFDIEKNQKPKEKQDGTVDYQDLGIVHNVYKDQTLCTIKLHTDGTEGLAVTGEKLTPVNGIPVPNLSGSNTMLNEEGTAITSAINGHAVFAGGKINVNDTFYVDGDVDNSTGSIKVNCNIVITGMVLSGFSVEADGNIEVKDNIESAMLKSGGNIVLRSGINGGTINCSGDLTSRFIENCNVTVKGSITSEYVLNSNIQCDNSIEIKGFRARFTGGSCIVGKNFTAPTIGSSNGIKTHLELGTNPEIIERQQNILNNIPAYKKQINSLTQLISLLEQFEAANRLNPEKKLALDEARKSYKNISAQSENEKRELDEINTIIESNGYGKIICSGTIYNGTSVKIGSAKLAVTDPLTNVTLFNSNGEICSGSAR